MQAKPDTAEPRPPRRLREVAGLFLKLGFLGFGGPVAHIALMQDEVVVRRAWLTQQDFLDLVGATNLIPGPNSTEVAMAIGLRRAGAMGLLVAGLCFICPAALMVTALAWAYVTYGSVPSVARLFHGVQPAVIALILAALWKLGRAAIKDYRMVVLAGAIAIASYQRLVDDTLLLLGGALLGMAWLRLASARRGPGRPLALAPPPVWPAGSGPGLAAVAGGAAAAGAAAAWWEIGLYFLKVGSVIYGGGFVLLKFLESDVVHRYRWLGPSQLVDAIAVGQITPGPVFTTATFIGYVVGGHGGHPLLGAAAATAGIFLPAFVLVVLLHRVLLRLRKWSWSGQFLDGINVSAVALMGAVLARLAQRTLVVNLNWDQPQWPMVILAALGVAALVRFKVPAVAVLLASAAIGWLLPLAPLR